MGVCLSGIMVKGRVEPSEEIIHFHWGNDTIIFLNTDYWDVIRFSIICEAGLLRKANFSEDEHVDDLFKILEGRSFIVFFYSEFADLTAMECAVIFKDGHYKGKSENTYLEFTEMGLSFDFMFEPNFWNYERAKSGYLKIKNGTIN